jgi:type I restriction enzyme R subunit
MLTTGVDARNVRNIVLVRNIGSMVEFKQIIGRGTRVYDNKDFFTILDFTASSDLFQDAEWDGLPEEETTTTIEVGTSKPKGTKQKEGVEEEEEGYTTGGGAIDLPEPKQKVKVYLSSDRTIEIKNIAIQYIDEDGRPLTADEFLRRIMSYLPR